ncbi:MAG: 50S ribosomal protein L25/general stress protein Ctc [Prevotella sp.]|nr:50S ribosomal protein L25/general stress protein Ctc [Prevotella sp.]MBQ4295727.1 50S ribosomal protein L25/general stress protein Ctc [Prevotella sp.]MBR7054855.1 50S ribosomal protein L25/general stress protein Ctc [Prevotella sp.]
MKEISLKGQKRAATGKKATKQMRKEGLVPCNLYGEARDENGKPQSLAFAVAATDLRKVIYTPHVYVINLDIDGEHHTAVMKELQFHPTTDAVLHIDFYEINEAKPLTIGIPVHLVGLAQGIRDGGRMNLSIRKIEVTAPFQQIPEQLDVDVTHLQIGKSIKVGELSYEGLEFATSKEVVVCSIKMTRAASKNAAATEEAAEE